MRLTAWVILGMVGLMFSGCEENECGCIGEQPVYFEYRYVNHAWGYQEHGWLIDGEGHLKSYNLPEGFRMPDSTGMISREDLLHNLSLTDSTIQTLASSELDTYTSLIPAAADGEIGAARNIAADAGVSVLSGYLYDREKDAYRYVFLAMSGDWEQFNLSSEAETLVDWLLDFDVFWLSR